jgi:hypothetical protein
MKDSYPNYKTCMCKWDTGVFAYRDIKRMTIQQVEAQAADTRERLSNVNKQARESIENILRSSLMEGFNTLLNLKSKKTESNVLAATAALMPWKQFKSKELHRAIQNSFGSLATKLHSTNQDVCEILNIGWKVSQGINSTRTNLGECFFCCMLSIHQLQF